MTKTPSIPSDPHHLRETMNRINTLGPNQHFILPPDVASLLNLASLRSRLSQLYATTRIRIRLHTNRQDHSLWVWHDPNPAPTQPRTLEPLLEVLATTTDPATKQAALETLAIPKPTSVRNRSPNSTWVPLRDTLALLNLTQAEWESIPPLLQLQYRIDTGIAIRNTRNERRQSLKHSIVYQRFRSTFGLSSPAQSAGVGKSAAANASAGGLPG